MKASKFVHFALIAGAIGFSSGALAVGPIFIVKSVPLAMGSSAVVAVYLATPLNTPPGGLEVAAGVSSATLPGLNVSVLDFAGTSLHQAEVNYQNVGGKNGQIRIPLPTLP